MLVLVRVPLTVWATRGNCFSTAWKRSHACASRKVDAQLALEDTGALHHQRRDHHPRDVAHACAHKALPPAADLGLWRHLCAQPPGASPLNASRQQVPGKRVAEVEWVKVQQIFYGKLGIGFPLIRFEGDPHPRTADQN